MQEMQDRYQYASIVRNEGNDERKKERYKHMKHAT